MINAKKIIVGAAFLLASAGLFAQTITFMNKLQSDVVTMVTNEDGTSCDFAGLKNRVKATVKSTKLDIGLDMNFWAYTGNDTVVSLRGPVNYPYLAVGQKNNLISAGWAITDYWVEFRPVTLLGVGFHKSEYIPGSYLPVAGKNISAANIGSDLGVFVRPIENLTIGGGLDFVSVFGGYNDYHNNPLLNAGIEYTIPKTVGFGVSFRDFINDSRSFGIYASVLCIKNLKLNFGFTYNGSFADVSGNIMSAGVMFEKDALAVNADFVIDVDDGKNDGYDLYSAVDVSYGITAPMTLGVAAYFNSDFDYDKDRHIGKAAIVGINPYVTYAVNSHNELYAGVNIEFPGDVTITLPVYWKYSF